MLKKIDKKRFIPAVILVAAVLIWAIAELDNLNAVASTMYSVITGEFGWVFVLTNIVCFVFTLWIILGPYANVRMAGQDAKPDFDTVPWLGMMFTTGCSAGLVIYGFVEPLIQVSNPAFGIEPFSVDAYEFAQAYSHFDWGFICWGVWTPAAIAISYLIYNKKQKQARFSAVFEPMFKGEKHGIIDIIVDAITVFGIMVGPITSMGVGIPLLTTLIQELFNLPKGTDVTVQIIVMVLWVAIFGTSVYLGLEKGIKRLSNFNIGLFFTFMVIVGCLAGVSFIFKAEIHTLGVYFQNFIKYATYTDAYGDGSFFESWAAWYWAWITAYVPMMAIFIAKVSKGRTLKEIASATMIVGSLGCFVAMMTFGNYSLKVQMAGEVDLAGILNSEGQVAAILAIVRTMPFPKVMLVILTILLFVFISTTMDSCSFVAAEVTSEHKEGEQASRLLRMFWAFMAIIITLVLLNIGGFSAIQTLSILAGLPIAVILILIVITMVKILRKDYEEK